MKVSTIGIGLGGSNLAIALRNKFEGEVSLINLSEQDVNAVKEQNVPKERILILGKNGAGKDRQVSKSQFEIDVDKFKNFLQLTYSDAPEVVFVCFSLAGGTGSGLGPLLTAYAGSDELAIKGSKRPLIIGIAACPDIGDGTTSMVNAVEALKEISKFTDKGVARYYLVNNSAVVSDDLKIKHTALNDQVATFLYRFFNVYGTSRVGVIDKADRFRSISQPGIHSLIALDGNGEPFSPFIIPEGCRVRGCTSEVAEGDINTVSGLVGKLGLEVDDYIHGFYNETDELSPIVGFTGVENLRKVSERYRHRLNLLKARATETHKQDLTTGKGLTGIGGEKRWIDDQYKPKSAADASAILNLMDDDED